ncbi:MAG: hypothetical protein RL577_929 [Bacteroidota bacterium]
MNFLGHFVLDHQEGQSLYNAGLLGPDLIRNASKGQFKPNWKDEIHPIDWHRGARQHLQRDAWFHQHPFFHILYSENRDSVRQAFESVQIPRFYFGLHVAIEMSLDKALLTLYPNAAQRMYSDLEKAFPQIAQWLTEQEFPQAIAGVERFIDSRYIERYQANSDLAYGLMRVYMQTGASQQEWSAKQLAVVAGIMGQLVESNQKHLPSLIT